MFRISLIYLAFFTVFLGAAISGSAQVDTTREARKIEDPLLTMNPKDREPSQNQQTRGEIYNRETVKKYAKVLYRGPTEQEKRAIAVTQSELSGYGGGEGLSGVFRLVADQRCDEANKGAVRDSMCAKYSMPGNGSSYSFRTNRYRLSRLADLQYHESMLRAGSRFTMGILARLTETDLKQVSLVSAGVREVADLQAPRDLTGIRDLYYDLESGFKLGGHFCSNMLPLETGAVYVLRSIAFRGTNPQTVQNITYDESDFDKRVDILVAFKVLRGTDQSIIILWKELRNQTSPKLGDKRE